MGCGNISVRESGFLRRFTVADQAGLSTTELLNLSIKKGKICEQNPSISITMSEAEAPVIEPHLLVRDLADRWQMSVSTVGRLFEEEPGVLRLGKSKRSLRIPISVATRVHRQLTAREAK
jgi:hypothetical protein